MLLHLCHIILFILFCKTFILFKKKKTAEIERKEKREEKKGRGRERKKKKLMQKKRSEKQIWSLRYIATLVKKLVHQCKVSVVNTMFG